MKEEKRYSRYTRMDRIVIRLLVCVVFLLIGFLVAPVVTMMSPEEAATITGCFLLSGLLWFFAPEILEWIGRRKGRRDGEG